MQIGTALRRPSDGATIAGVLTALTSDGKGVSGFAVYSGVTPRLVSKGYQQATGVRDGVTLTYAPAFQGTPYVSVTGGITYEPRAAQWGPPAYNSLLPQYPQQYALNGNAVSCQIRARLRQKATPTARNVDNFAAPLAASTAGASTGSASPSFAPASNDTYTARARLSITVSADGTPSSQTAVVILESNHAAGGWVERARISKSISRTAVGNATALFDLAPSVVVTGIVPADLFRWTLVSDTPGGGSSGFSVLTANSGTNNNAMSGLSYSTSAGDSFASMTPDTDDGCTVDALEVSA